MGLNARLGITQALLCPQLNGRCCSAGMAYFTAIHTGNAEPLSFICGVPTTDPIRLIALAESWSDTGTQHHRVGQLEVSECEQVVAHVQ